MSLQVQRMWALKLTANWMLQVRLEGPEGLTGEKYFLKDKLVVKYFETAPFSANEKLKAKTQTRKRRKIEKDTSPGPFPGTCL